MAVRRVLRAALSATLILMTLRAAVAALDEVPELGAWTESAPTIDGVIGDSEWQSAAKFSTVVANRTLELYVMNDASNLYLAVKIADPNPGEGSDCVRFEFDSDNDGDFSERGEDALQLYSTDDFHDYASGLASTVSASEDERNGGRRDGTGAASNSSSYNFFEISHPLNSGDDLDIHIHFNDVIGARLIVYDQSTGSWLGGYPALKFQVKASARKLRVTVVVIDLLGSRVQGANVRVQGPDLPGGQVESTTNSAGEAVFEQVPVGTYDISTDGTTRTAQVLQNTTVTLNVTTTMNLVLLGGGGVVLLIIVVAAVYMMRRPKPAPSAPEIPPPPPS